MDVRGGATEGLSATLAALRTVDDGSGLCGRLAYTKFTRDSFRVLGAFWKRRDSRVNWVRFEAGRDSQREFTRLHCLK